MKHSWPRRSGKTGAAIMKAAENKWPIYFCGCVPKTVERLGLRNLVRDIHGLTHCVIDNFEYATAEEKAIVATMDDVEIFGTFGSDADDYKICTSEVWKSMIEGVARGLISKDLALRDMNIHDVRTKPDAEDF